MRSCLRALVLFSAAMLLEAPANASGEAQTYITLIDGGSEVALQRLGSIADGIGWSNAYLHAHKQTPIYCAPENLAIQADQHADILRRFVKNNPRMADQPVGFVLLHALRSTFPCDQ